jgi:uncharacterized caspase-like protein
LNSRVVLLLAALAATLAVAGEAFAQRDIKIAAPPANEQRVALVIGNGAYKHTAPLVNPPNDARLMADTLATLGFRLIGGRALLNADKPAMEKAIREFGQRLRGGAVGLFYYAGHGVQVKGENYLIPVAANIADESDVKYELVSAGFVLDEMANANNRLNVVILDACRNNPFGGRGLRSASSGLAQVTAPAGTVISYATQPGNVALDGSAKHSPYTAALAAAMRKPGLGVFETFNEVGLAVKTATGGRQQPWFATSPIEGTFQFVPGAASARTPQAGKPVVGVDPAAIELAFWESVKGSNNAADFQEYLDQYPAGRFAGLARNRLRVLESTQVATVAPSITETRPTAVPGSIAGMTLSEPSAEQRNHLKITGGIVVEDSQDAAARAGIRRGDIILAVNTQNVKSIEQFGQLLGQFEQGRIVALLVRRGTNALYVPFRIEITATRPTAAPGSIAGMTLSEPSAEQRNQLKITGGIVVDNVQGAAVRAGIHRGDIIVAVNNQDVKTLDQFGQLWGQFEQGRIVTLLVRRGRNALYLPFRIE